MISKTVRCAECGDRRPVWQMQTQTLENGLDVYLCWKHADATPQYVNLDDLRKWWALELNLPNPNDYSKQFELYVNKDLAKTYNLPVGARVIRFGSTLFGWTKG